MPVYCRRYESSSVQAGSGVHRRPPIEKESDHFLVAGSCGGSQGSHGVPRAYFHRGVVVVNQCLDDMELAPAARCPESRHAAVLEIIAVFLDEGCDGRLQPKTCDGSKESCPVG